MKGFTTEIVIHNSCQDATAEIKKRLQESSCEELKISFEKGVYHFKDTNTFREEYYPSNNDGGMKHIVFLLKKYKTVVIDGNNSEFVIDGRISPFILDQCENVTLRNMVIDCTRPYFTQGEIVDAGSGFVELKIDKVEFPCKVQGTNLVVYSDFWDNDLSEITVLTQEFSPVTKAPAHGGHTALAKIGRGSQNTENLPAEYWELDAYQKENGNILLQGSMSYIPKKGNYLVMTHEKRENSFCFIKDCQEVLLENVIIHHIGSMGVIAQNSGNITISDCAFALREGTGRLVSVNADATHFVNCHGKIWIKNTLMENMMDDGGNIHGIYTIIQETLSKSEIIVELMHFQQSGVQIYNPGDKIAFYVPDTLAPAGHATVRYAALIDLNHIRIVFEEPVEFLKIHDIVENITKMPEVLIENCRTGNNRPRGFLLNTPRKTVVRNNVFYNSSSGIQLNGDANYWYESGFTRDVLIENNVFSDCCYIYDDYPVHINPDFSLEDNKTYFHGNIRILNNTFKTFSNTMIYAKSVEKLTILNNTVINTKTHLCLAPAENPISIHDCKHIITAQ